MSEFASRLRELRNDAGLRQKDLADALGVAQTTVANYEQGARFPDEAILRRIADRFTVSLDYLLGRSDVNLLAQEVRFPAGYSDGDGETLAPMRPEAKRYMHLLLKGRRDEAGDLVLNAVRSGLSLREIYTDVFERTLKEIGLLWLQNRVDVAMEHYFSASTQIIMSQLYPVIRKSASRKNGRLVLAIAVCGEFHDIGARMVADFLEMDGWKSLFMGSNLCNEDIVSALVDHRPDLLALSATMFYNVESIARAVRAVRAVELLNDVTILVGGRPFNQNHQLWKQVKAEGSAANAADAVDLANRLVGKRTASSHALSV